jgi:YHS domain-containing protein
MSPKIQPHHGLLKAKAIEMSPWGRDSSRLAALFLCFMVAFPVAMAPGMTARAQALSLSDGIIADPLTGAALLGFDPVAYFIEKRAVSGKTSHQILYGGKVWYFASGANKNAFEANPELYLPVFGGHDPVAVAAGFIVAGSPEYFAIEKDRVYLFRHAESRDAFLRDASISATATSHWPQVKRDLAP